MDRNDPLIDVLKLAQQEGALEGPGLEALARALNERARFLLDGRVRALESESTWRQETIGGLEEKVRSLEREVAWRQETIGGLEETVRSLEREVAWRQETIGGLEETVRSLEREVAWRRDTAENLEKEAVAVRASGQAAAQAHERLLTHHRQVLGRIAVELAALTPLRLTRLRAARRRLADLADMLRSEGA